MRKFLSGIMLAVMLAACFSGVAMAEGEALVLAAPQFDWTRFEKYASYLVDRETGVWSVSPNETINAFSLISDNAGKYSDGLLYMSLDIQGNYKTGMVMPVLVIYAIDADEMAADGVSLAVGGMRYDYAKLTSEVVSIGRYRAEKIALPMDGEGLSMLKKMTDVGEGRLRLYGEKLSSTTFKKRDAYKNAREQIEGLSLGGIGAMLRELDQIGMDRYGLWDLNEGRWKADRGALPDTGTEAIASEAGEGIALNEDFGLLSRAEKNMKASVTALQKLLVDAGFMTGKTNGTFGQTTRDAVMMAQRYYGLTVTGSADKTLIDRLSGKTAESQKEETAAVKEAVVPSGGTAASGVCYKLGEIAELELGRYWFASTLVSSDPTGSLSEKSSLNADNTLLIFDGAIRNISAVEMAFFRDVTAVAKYGDKYEFALTPVCQSDGGKRFDNTLISLGQARLALYAEVPKSLSQAGDSWTLEITAGDVTLTYFVQ